MLARSSARFAPAPAAAALALLVAACGGGETDPPAADAKALAPARARFVHPMGSRAMRQATDRDAPEYRAAAGADGSALVEIAGERRAAYRVLPLLRLGVGALGDAPAGPTVRLAFDAIAVPRTADDAAALESRPETILVRRGDMREQPLTVTGTWTTFVVDPMGALDDGLPKPDGGRLEIGRASEDEERAIVLVANPRLTVVGSKPPTVVLITSDTHRADHVSAIDPASPIATPHIDALAREGALFTNCFASTNFTNPSHGALMTGVHPRDSKVVDNRTRLHESAETIAERFRAAGYQTYAALSAFHLDDDVSGFGQGFDRVSAPATSARDGAETLEIAGRWIDDAEGSPLFLWLHLFDAHTPYELPESDLAAIRANRPDPLRADADLGVADEYVPKWLGETGVRDTDFVRALYAGEVRYLDGLLEPFFARPRIAGASIAFTADHGESLGELDVWWDHFGLHRPTVHVPLVLRGPGATPGAVTGAPVRQIDVGRTLLDMAGLEGSEFPGRDLRDALGEAPPLEPRFMMSGSGMSAAVELDGWLLELYLRDAVVETSGREHPLGRVYLYHLPTDPDCARDRVVDELDRARTMRDALIAWMDRAQVTGLNSINHDVSPEVEAKLAELGYTGGFESAYRWWRPEDLDPEWDSNPWNVAFQKGGDRALLREAIRTASGDR